MTSDRDRTYMLHVRDAIDAISSYTTGGREQFFADRKTQDAALNYHMGLGQLVLCDRPDVHAGPPASNDARSA